MNTTRHVMTSPVCAHALMWAWWGRGAPYVTPTTRTRATQITSVSVSSPSLPVLLFSLTMCVCAQELITLDITVQSEEVLYTCTCTMTCPFDILRMYTLF